MTIVIIPTYNEKDNIKFLVEEIFSLSPDIDILVVDDNSPDGTADVVRGLKNKFPRLILEQRLNDKGFGKSYIDGFKKAIGLGEYEMLAMLDADFSHDPKEIPEMLKKLSECDTVIGSRYVRGGRIENWNWRRRLLSRFANFYARTVLGTPIRDLTTGFMCFRKDILKSVDPVRSSRASGPEGTRDSVASATSNGVDLDSIKSEGYAFLVEFKYKIFKAGFKISEHPIVFNERREGQSKMSFKNIWEAIWLPWELKFSKE